MDMDTTRTSEQAAEAGRMLARDEIIVFLADEIGVDLAAEVLLADGLEGAFLGVAQRFNSYFAVYDADRCIEIFMESGSSYEEAVEHFEFNVVGAWVGEATPAFIKLLPTEPTD
jgi:hypothetical protein